MFARPAILRKFQRFASDQHAVAVVEFALILPVLLLLYLGSIEASSLITVDRRVNVISGTVGDLVSRWDPDGGKIPSATLDDYFKASESIIYPYPSAGLSQVVSVLKVAANGTATVAWSCGYNGGVKHAKNSTFTSLPANVNLLARDVGTVVMSETMYPYRPLLGMVLTETYNLNRASYYLPRLQDEIEGPTSC